MRNLRRPKFTIRVLLSVIALFAIALAIDRATERHYQSVQQDLRSSPEAFLVDSPTANGVEISVTIGPVQDITTWFDRLTAYRRFAVDYGWDRRENQDRRTETRRKEFTASLLGPTR